MDIKERYRTGNITGYYKLSEKYLRSTLGAAYLK